jgi:imidazole glycerol-phosphate synthase subunit HisH
MKQKIAVIKYNAGNIFSVANALEQLQADYILTDDEKVIQSADKIIFPGVGEASSAMQYLKSKQLDTVIRNLKQPVLGICLGMQIMCKHSEENDTSCLAIFDVPIKKFSNSSKQFKVPHMGWNTIGNLKSPLFKGIDEQVFVYFVHSYFAEMNPYAIADTNYSLNFCAALHRDNFYGVQFHPEKSGDIGFAIIQNFIDL